MNYNKTYTFVNSVSMNCKRLKNKLNDKITGAIFALLSLLYTLEKEEKVISDKTLILINHYNKLIHSTTQHTIQCLLWPTSH